MAPVNPADPALVDKITISLTYAKLYPSIVKDFMGKQDCAAVHASGNMLASTTGSSASQSGPVSHLLAKGGSDMIAQSKKAAYQATIKIGDLDNLLILTGVSE